MRLFSKSALTTTLGFIVTFIYFETCSIEPISSYENNKSVTLKTLSTLEIIESMFVLTSKIKDDSSIAYVKPPHQTNPTIGTTGKCSRSDCEIALAVVACGGRLQESLTMIKSAIFFSDGAKLKIFVVTDDPLVIGFQEKLEEWRDLPNYLFEYKILPLSFPENNKEEWRKLFRPCAAQRLFLPSVLKDMDAVLYVDTDTLFLSPLRDVWRHLALMNSTHIAALAPEHEDVTLPNWYRRFARHPYYGQLGVNSGVMLMNLTRMREFGWENYLMPVYNRFKLKLTWGDQDIINIIFAYRPERLYVYSCRFNYRTDHCSYINICQDANKHGVAVIHGNRRSFHADTHSAFKTIYSVMNQYTLGSDPRENLLLPLKRLLRLDSSRCGKVGLLFTRNLNEFTKRHQRTAKLLP